MKAHHHFTHCSYLGYEFTKKQHTPCRAAPSNRSQPLLDYFEGTASSGDIALGGASPAVANQTYSTTLFGTRALGIIHAHPDAHASHHPLFLFLSLSATHKPFLAPTSYLQRVALAHPPNYFRECPWVVGTAVKCRAHHRKGYEAMAAVVDDLIGQLRAALDERGMWQHTLMIFASDNGGPIGPQASNVPLRGGKDTNLEGGVRTLAALGGGALPTPLRGAVSHAFMHESDWLPTLARVAGAVATDTRAAAQGLPPIDGLDIWPAWMNLVDNVQRLRTSGSAVDTGGSGGSGGGTAGGSTVDFGPPRTIVLATRLGLPGTPYGGTSALIDVQHRAAYKLIRGIVCECPECRPCATCNGSGCVFDVIADPAEQNDLAAHRPDLVADLSTKLDVAVGTKFVDRAPINAECWEHPKDDPDHWMEVALARGSVMQPWLRIPSHPNAKPRLLYPHLKRRPMAHAGHSQTGGSSSSV